MTALAVIVGIIVAIYLILAYVLDLTTPGEIEIPRKDTR